MLVDKGLFDCWKWMHTRNQPLFLMVGVHQLKFNQFKTGSVYGVVPEAKKCECKELAVYSQKNRAEFPVYLWRYSLVVRTQGFHPCNRGSNPRSVTIKISNPRRLETLKRQSNAKEPRLIPQLKLPRLKNRTVLREIPLTCVIG